ncbi:GNAT family N-acetyltransferase [Shewanella sp. UCD-KL12]|uniref:GNAT family N-acetyltransferase n=1 Tax=Shewanella sp. UCD-KL12 TaxID=1917163 RepID=UPI001181086B|nr:GNAT family N-acetyltransferase [Shewanella sp. UCD-KL12]
MLISELKVEFLASIELIPTTQWNSLMQGSANSVNPFTRHQYLSALEKSRCVCTKSGWTPMHLSVLYKGKRIAVMPLYNKTHSYGEYVFDWAWAEAYERNHIEYYPKLLSAIPFTPVTGNRMGIDVSLSGKATADVITFIFQSLNQEVTRGEYSGWHCLFMPKTQHNCISNTQRSLLPISTSIQSPLETSLGLEQATPPLKRTGTQFHWQNHDYRDFADFLSTMSSRKRKNIIKERAKAINQGYTFRFIEGELVTDAQWQAFYYCYQITYAKRSGHYGYLNLEFFKLLGKTMAEQVLLLVVEKPITLADNTSSLINESDTSQIVAAAIYFKSDTHLYGRYWGALESADVLHFEACYYQGIEYCIKHGLDTFDAGAQGEHKIARGFEPVVTYSNHEIAHPAFREAIEGFVQQESEQNRRYMIEAAKLLPFKDKGK